MVDIHAAVDAKCTLFTLAGVEMPVERIGSAAEDRDADVYTAPLEQGKQYYWVEWDGDILELHQLLIREGVVVNNIIFTCLNNRETFSPEKQKRLEKLALPTPIRTALGV